MTLSVPDQLRQNHLEAEALAAPERLRAILRCCARVRLEPAHVEQIRRLVPADSSPLIAAARLQGMAPLCCRHLSVVCPEHAPAAFDELRTYSRQNRRRTQELLRLLALFRGANLEAVPFKGPTLAVLAYGGVSFKQFVDLDLLLRRHDAAKARQVLEQAGYVCTVRLRPGRQAAYLRTLGQQPFWHPDRRVQVELHTDLLPPGFGFPLTFDEVAARRQWVDLLGEKAPTLSMEHLLVYLCAHGGKHLWSRLGWLCDLGELIRNNQDALDWGLIRQEADRLHVRRLLLLGLYLAQTVLEVPLPAAVQVQFATDSLVPGLANLLLPGREHPVRFYLRSRERRRDGLRYVLEMLFAPTEADWKAVPLPEFLAPLHYAIRPFRLAAKHLRWSRHA